MNGAGAPEPRHVLAIRRLASAVHRHRRRAAGLLAAAIAAGVLANGIRFVSNGEAGVVRRLGSVVRPVAAPGALYVIPFVDALERVAVGEVREMDLSQADGSPLEVTTGDENLLAVRALLQYRIEDAAHYRTRHRDADAILRVAARTALTREAAGRGVEELLTTGKAVLAESVRRKAQEAVDAVEGGVRILSVSILSAGPPSGAEEAFNAVASAAAEKERRVNEAEGRRAESLALSRAEADRIRSAAESARRERVEAARAARTRFAALAKEVAPARSAGLAHLRLEALRGVLSRARLILLPARGGSIRTFLPPQAASRATIPEGPLNARPDAGTRAAEGVPAGEAGGGAPSPRSPEARPGTQAPSPGAPAGREPSGPPPGLLPPVVPEDLLPRVLVPESKVR